MTRWLVIEAEALAVLLLVWGVLLAVLVTVLYRRRGWRDPDRPRRRRRRRPF